MTQATSKTGFVPFPAIPLPHPGAPDGCHVRPRFILINRTGDAWIILPLHKQGRPVRIAKSDCTFDNLQDGPSQLVEGFGPRCWYPVHRFGMTAGRLRRLVDEFAEAEKRKAIEVIGIGADAAQAIERGTAQLSRWAQDVLRK